MIDRALAIIGIALLLITWFMSYLIHTMPAWLSLGGGALGVLLFGIGLGLSISGRRANVLRDNAELRLHMYGDDRQPTRISATNIWRWYSLRNIVMEIDAQTGQYRERAVTTILIVSFDVPVRVGTLEVHSPDTRLPRYETKEFNNRFAIITFSDNLSAGTLEIRAQQ